MKDLPLLGQRANIYDNDEFDIFNRENIDLSRIHRGKKLVNNTMNFPKYSLIIIEDEIYQQILMTNLIWKECMNIMLV